MGLVLEVVSPSQRVGYAPRPTMAAPAALQRCAAHGPVLTLSVSAPVAERPRPAGAMELNASRTAARTRCCQRSDSPDGPERCCRTARSTARPAALRGDGRGGARGLTCWQARIVAVHAERRDAHGTVAAPAHLGGLYAELADSYARRLIELDPRGAIGMAEGTRLRCDIVGRTGRRAGAEADRFLESVRGNLLFKLGRSQKRRAGLRPQHDWATGANMVAGRVSSMRPDAAIVR